MPDLSLLVPTRGRPHLLRQLLESIRATTHRTESIEVVLYVDDDDEATKALTFDGLPVVRIVGAPDESMGRMFASCFEAAHGSRLMLLNDDVVFRTSGWDAAVASAFARFPDGIALVYGNDLDQGRRVPTFPIVSRRTCEIVGGICPPGYLNLHIESHLHDIFRQLASRGHERTVYMPDVVFQHLRPATSRKRDPAHDDRLFLSLAEEREAVAEKLARHIEGRRVATASHASIVLPVLPNTLGEAARSLQGLFQQEGFSTAMEIVLVAGAGEERLLRAQEGSERIRVVHAGAAPIYAHAVNAGAREARSPNVVALSAGDVPAPGWLAALLGALESPHASVAGSRILDGRNGRVHHAGLGFRLRNGKLRVSHLARGLAGDHPAALRPRELQGVSGSGMLVRRDVFLRLGGFAVDRPGVEGIDLCTRVRAEGGRVVYVPGAVIHHHPNPAWQERAGEVPYAYNGCVRDDLDELLAPDGLTPPESLDRERPRE
jgi:GT2 family glycosyltransferase